MLFILIPAAWLAIAVFVVVLCRMSARGDEALMIEQRSGIPSSLLPGLVLFEDRHDRGPRDERLGARRVTADSTSGRRARCVVS